MATGLNSKFEEINNAVLNLVCRLYADHDFEKLESIGIPFDLAQRLVEQDRLVINRLTNYKSSLIRLEVDQNALGNLVAHLERETDKDYLINNMIINGAPSEMIVGNWGIDKADYFSRKKHLAVKYVTGPGRLPKRLRKKDRARISRYMAAYQRSARKHPDKEPGWRLLEASIETHVPLHLAWVYMKENLGNTNIGDDTWTDLMLRPVLV
ncbi:MAG TPA: DUF2857 family protein [Anaerolineae bacterium]|nr:DUF2857 family protein [Anaerolineae bacterium]